jgi:hypothetical protein
MTMVLAPEKKIVKKESREERQQRREEELRAAGGGESDGDGEAAGDGAASVDSGHHAGLSCGGHAGAVAAADADTMPCPQRNPTRPDRGGEAETKRDLRPSRSEGT